MQTSAALSSEVRYSEVGQAGVLEFGIQPTHHRLNMSHHKTKLVKEERPANDSGFDSPQE